MQGAGVQLNADALAHGDGVEEIAVYRDDVGV